MKKTLKLYAAIIAVFVNTHVSQGQSDSLNFFRSIKFNGVAGFKIFNPYASYQPINKGALYFPLTLGIEAYSPDVRLSVDFRQSYFFSLSGRDSFSDISYSRKHTLIGLTYHFKRRSLDKRPIRVGLSYSHIKTKETFAAIFGFPSKMHGASVMIGIPLKWLDIEFRAEPDQEDILGGDKYSLGIVYRFGGKEKEVKTHGGNTFNLLVGAHASLNRNYYDPNNTGDLYSPVMVMPEIGFQYVFTNYNLSLEARRNHWLGFTGGDPRYDINGNMEHLFLGLSRQRMIKRQSFTYGLSYVWIRDIGSPVRIPVTANNAVEYYTEKGIALTVSHPIRKIDIEARAIYAYHLNQYINSPVINEFDRYRISFGAIYRINPLRKK
jgi:hypothetical protein